MHNALVTETKKTLQKIDSLTSLAGRSSLKSPLATRDHQHRRPFMQLSTENNQMHARLFSSNRLRSGSSAVHAFLDSTKSKFMKKTGSAGKSRSSHVASAKTSKVCKSPTPTNWQTGTPCVLSSKLGDQLSPIFSSLLHYNLDDLEEIGTFFLELLDDLCLVDRKFHNAHRLRVLKCRSNREAPSWSEWPANLAWTYPFWIQSWNRNTRW